MVDSKGIVGEEEDPPVTPDENEGTETADEAKSVIDGGDDQTNGSDSSSPVPRRAPGTKEIIPFRWKLLGESHGAILTLFKSVERSETEAQYQRAHDEGYYSGLRIVDIDEKTVQPPSAQRFPESTVAAKPKEPRTKTKPKHKAKRIPAKVKAKKAGSKSAKPKATKTATTRSAKTSKSAKVSKVTKAVKTAKTVKTPKAKKTVKKEKTARTSAKATKKKTETRKSRKRATTKK